MSNQQEDDRPRCLYCGEVCEDPAKRFPRMCVACFRKWQKQMDIVETFKSDEAGRKG